MDEIPETLRTTDVFPPDLPQNGMHRRIRELVDGLTVGFDGGEFTAQEGIEDSIGVFGGFHGIKRAEPDFTPLQGKCQAPDSGKMPGQRRSKAPPKGALGLAARRRREGAWRCILQSAARRYPPGGKLPVMTWVKEPWKPGLS